ncbi:uncharacterized protein LOC103519855 [Diaphorina citri]|uniref:Uncharacterized protein LOC103519855 n=1 Tax=Diaphorina citri TaxID=121845 RepID=A0A1S3DK16_DIACI|nr:uncharacterized protein LOC103519855 [Diaphorina citri]KAI5705886.1 hypothetical protein M8J75_002694 [Diaphorina citri]KAI5741678.1 hypothetical protein M8J76_016008 [Diaphorina citri]KAI5746404.1 hypothetical protein M8J77_003263 [Diaphorina citri]
MPSKPKVSFAEFVESNTCETEMNVSLAQNTVIDKMRQSLSNILCFRATDSRGHKPRPRISRTQEIHDLIGSRVSLKLDCNKSDHDNNLIGSKVSLKVVKNKKSNEQDRRREYECRERRNESPINKDSPVSSVTRTSGFNQLRPARTYCDIYRNSLVKLRSGFSQISQKRPDPNKTQSAREIKDDNTDETNEELVEKDITPLSHLNLKKSVHIYEFTNEQVQKMKKKGCIKLNVKVKPEVFINDLDIIIDRSQVVAVATTASASKIEHKK